MNEALESAATPAQVAEYVKVAIRRYGTARQAAQILGIKPSTLSCILNGKHYLSPKSARRLAELLKIDENYLMTGVPSPGATTPSNMVIPFPNVAQEAVKEMSSPDRPYDRNVDGALWTAFMSLSRDALALEKKYAQLLEAMDHLCSMMHEQSEFKARAVDALWAFRQTKFQPVTL